MPLWRTVACAAVLSGRRANTVASWEGRRGRRVESAEWRGLLECVYDIAGVGGRSRRRAHFCRIPNKICIYFLIRHNLNFKNTNYQFCY